MRKILIITSLLLMGLLITGCRGKARPDLHRAGETRVWPTVDTAELQQAADARPRVEVVTTRGNFVVELYPDAAPVSVANFLKYVNDGFYSGTIFHRVEPGLVVQGGGFTADLSEKDTRDPIPNEAGNGLRNLRGTVGMARTMEMESATAQFFINLVDNPGFNGDGKTGGYAVFGRVYEGMEIVDSMVLVETTTRNGMSNVPQDPIVIQSIRQIQ